MSTGDAVYVEAQVKRSCGRSLVWTPAFLLILLGATRAGAQCTISGPATLCGGSAELCGPDGPYFYTWTDANGNELGDAQCLTVVGPGTYFLSTYDFINGLGAGPCAHDVASGAGAACSIDGASSGCQGNRIDLCGPAGQAEYEWSGPGGFMASSACVSVSAAGSYQLRVRSAVDACWGAPCVKAVSFASCDAPSNCPVAPWQWITQCRLRRSDRSRLFDPAQLSAIAASVDDRSALFAWRSPDEGFLRTLESRGNLRDRARRQFAGVLANVSVHDLGLVPRRGPKRGLDGATAVSLDGFKGRVDAWVAQSEVRLKELDGRLPRGRKPEQEYREIIRTGWQINHGQGMGAVCRPDAIVIREDLGATFAAPAIEDESLADELSAGLESPAILEVLSSNPAPGSARIAYVIGSSEPQDVRIGVFDVAGRMVRELDRGVRAPGRYNLAWDGRDSDGNVSRNGAYFVMGSIGAQRIQGRLILLH